jgi:hypothetical protein
LRVLCFYNGHQALLEARGKNIKPFLRSKKVLLLSLIIEGDKFLVFRF